MKRLTLKEMTESQRQRVNARLVQAKKRQAKPLTNSELNRIKAEVIDEIMRELAKEAKALRAEKEKEKQQRQPSEETFNWTANHRRRR